MKIDTLEIANFRSYDRFRFTLPHRAYIVGTNNVGKSTAIDALYWALSGKVRGLDGANREILELVREGALATLLEAGKASGLGVKLEVADFGRVTRSTDGREVFLKVKDWSGSNKEQQATLFEKLRTTAGVVDACLNTDAFLRLHHGDAKNLIMGVLDVRIPAEWLEPFDIAGPLALDELERHYKKAFETRTDRKRELAALVPFPKPELLSGEEPPAVAEMLEQLEAIRTEERGRLDVSAHARGERKGLEDQIATLNTERAVLAARIMAYGTPHEDLDDLDARLNQLESAADAHTRSAPPADVTPAPAHLAAGLFHEPTEDENALTAAKASLVDAEGRLRVLSSTTDGLDTHDPNKGCVLNAAVPCLTPSAEFGKIFKDTKKRIREIEKTVAGLTKEVAAIALRVDTEQSQRLQADRVRSDRAQQLYREARAWRERETQIANDREALRVSRQAVMAKVDRLQTDQDRFGIVMAELSRIQSALANLGPVTTDPLLEQLRERITRGEGMVETVRAWHQQNELHTKSLKRRATLEASVAALETRVEKLGPKGFIVTVLEEARATFESKVNAALVRWGYRLEFTIDPWTVRVNGRKAEQLSKSERLRVGVSLQLAIAEISGLWFVAIDECDMLMPRPFEILQDVIEDWPGQVVIALSKPDEYRAPAELPEGVAVYVLTLDGGITRPLLEHAASV